MVKTFEVHVPLETVGSERIKEALRKKLLIHSFGILVEQGLLSEEEAYCLRVELSGQNQRAEYAKSRNL